MTDEITFQPLTLRKLADKSEGTRVVRFDPQTGERKLVNPATPGDDHEPWPLLGIEIVGEIPEFVSIPTKSVERWSDEGYLTLNNPRPVFRPGGPANRPWAVTHTFTHVDSVTFHTVHGDLTYEPFGDRGQPDKYGEDDIPVSVENHYSPDHEIEWFYTMRLVS